MDLENYHVSYFTKKRKYAYENRKVELTLSYKHFLGFELMGLAHVITLVSLQLFNKFVKRHICKNTHISKQPTNTNVILTCLPPTITTNKKRIFVLSSKTKSRTKMTKTQMKTMILYSKTYGPKGRALIWGRPSRLTACSTTQKPKRASTVWGICIYIYIYICIHNM